MVDTVATVTAFDASMKKMQRSRLAMLVAGAFVALGGFSSFSSAQTGSSPPVLTLPSADLPAQGASGTGQAKRDELTFLPGVRSTLTYSSNLAHTPAASSGWAAEVSPYLNASVETERSKGQIYATLRTFFRTQGGSSATPDIRGNGQTALVGDWLWISGSANVYSISSNPFGSVSFDPALYNTNNAQFRQFQISPYIQGRVGTFADYQVRYALANASSTANVTLARWDHRFSGYLKSGPQFNKWGWEWNGETQRRVYDSGAVQGRNSASISGFIIPTQDLRIGVSANYDQIDNFVVNGKTSGTGLGVFADWSPSNRTTLSASAKRLYYGNTGKLALSHRYGLFIAALSFDKSVMTSSDGSILSMNSQNLFSAGGFSSSLNPIYNQLVSQNLIQSYGAAVGGGVLSDFVILSNTLTASVGYSSPINSLVLTAMRSRRDSDATRAPGAYLTTLGSAFAAPATLTAASLSAYRSTNFSVDWNHHLDSKSTLGLRVSHIDLENSDATTGYGRTKVKLIQSTYKTQLTTDTTAQFGLRHTGQKGSGIATSYDETALFGTVDVRF